MSLSVGAALTALAWAAGGGAAAWLAGWPLRRRSVAWLVVSVAATGTAASFGALIGAEHAMLVPMSTTVPLALLSAAAGAVALAVSVAVGLRVAREHRAVAVGLARLAPEGPRETRGLDLASGALTERLRQTSEALERSRERERALERARRELIAWISHDLRTPLAGLRAMTEALEDGIAPDPHLYYKQMAQAVDRLNAMVGDLFELSRLQAGLADQEAGPVDVAELAAACVAGLEPLAAAKGVDLRVPAADPGRVRGSAGELHRALTNVIANAIRHTPDGGAVEVRVDQRPPSGAAGERAGGSVQIAVRDECGGIDAAALPRVFEVGYRTDASRRTVDGGAGLGLAITRGIVEAHGGAVWAANEGLGCCFRLSLPIAE